MDSTISTPTGSQAVEMKRIFIGHNFFGAGNFGDDLMLQGFLAVAAGYPDVEITCCCPHDLRSQQLRFPRIHWLPEDNAVRDEALLNADIWLGLGGTPFQLDSGQWFLEHNERERRRCEALRKPMHLLSVGCESDEAAADPRSRALLAAVEYVWTRDERTALALRKFIDPLRLGLGADLAHLAFVDGTSTPPRESDVVGLLLAFERREHFDLSELTMFLERRAAQHTRWLVQEVRPLPYLERWILENLDTKARSRVSAMNVDYSAGSVEAYLRAFGAPEVVVTSRYHGALVAAWQGSKVVVVTRSAKLRAIGEDIGASQIESFDSRTAVEAAIATASDVSREQLQGLRERARSMCVAFFEKLTRGKNLAMPMPAAPQHGSPISGVPLRRESLRATIDLELPKTLSSGQVVSVPCVVKNRSDATYVSAPPNPIRICYRWYESDGTIYGAGSWFHTPLPRALHPGETMTAAVRICAPPIPGTYTIVVTLLQDRIDWFSDVDPASGASAIVAVL